MIYALGIDIRTPLADCIEDTLSAVKAKRTALGAPITAIRGQELMQPVMAALLNDDSCIEGYTFFESLCIRSARAALSNSGIDPASPRCVFILSSTKGDIWTPTAQTAGRIANAFGNETTPIVISLACTSGVAAQLTAFRLLEANLYDTAVVIGCDVLIEFVASGFQCVHAVSETPCRPFDKNRDGMNLGEAVGTMVLGRASTLEPHLSEGAQWQLLGGAIHNDANHISGPSRTAEGALRCLQDCLDILTQAGCSSDLACVGVHGTATAYNDEMESIALYRAGLADIPIAALKGYWGHTMGAAGVVETILTMQAVEEGWVPAVLGYQEQGTSYAVNVSNQHRSTNKQSFIKLLSGFGGVNAAVAWTKRQTTTQTRRDSKAHLTASFQIPANASLIDLYRNHIGDYPKFFKMDELSQLGFVATEMLLQEIRKQNPHPLLDQESTCIIMANRISSTKNNMDFYETIRDHTNYFPSPAYFVYTVPNVVTGEIAIRHHIYGETSFYILNREDDLQPIVEATIQTTPAATVVVGWLEKDNTTVKLYTTNQYGRTEETTERAGD